METNFMGHGIELVRDWFDHAYSATLATTKIKIILICAAVFLGSFYIVKIFRRLSLNPPGPPFLPLLGNFFTFNNNPYLYRTFSEYAKKYGDLCYLRIGPYPMVLISSQKMIRRMYVDHKEIFSDRAMFAPIDKYCGGAKGIIKVNYEENKINRRFVMQALRNFGMGKSLTDGQIQNEAQLLVQEISTFKDTSFDPLHYIEKAVSNIIFLLVTGKRNEYDDDNFISLMKNMNILMDKTGLGYRAFSFLPVWILKLISNDLNNSLRSYDLISNYIKNEINNHGANFDQNNINNFLDIYLKNVSDNSEQLKIENLQEMIFDLLLAGAETTSTTLRFFFFYMCKFPRVQEKCRNEIDTVIGNGRMININDKSRLIYNHAMNNELLRLSCIAPIALVHCISNDIKIDGYAYDKNTMFLSNIYGCHMDENVFPDPLDFRPERWIDSDGNLAIPPPEFMPFGIGPRSCMAEVLAKHEIFIFSTTILQRLKLSYDGPIIEEDITMGISRIIRQTLKIIATSVI